MFNLSSLVTSEKTQINLSCMTTIIKWVLNCMSTARRVYIGVSMGCSTGAPTLDGPPSYNLGFILDTEANIRNEGPQLLLAQRPLKA